jgi:ribonuclease HI
MSEHTLYTDGGSRGNPGPAAAGMVLEDPKGKIIKRAGKYLGKKTNNEAEYQALVLGMKIARRGDVDSLKCVLDSELIVKQLNGVYKVKSPNLRKYVRAVKELEKEFDFIEYTHVKRDKNEEADAMVNRVLDSRKA